MTLGRRKEEAAAGNFNANSAGGKEWEASRQRDETGDCALNAESLMILMKVAI